MPSPAANQNFGLHCHFALGTVRRILNQAAFEWRDDRGMTWLEHAAKFKLLPVRDKRAPYTLSREEQAALFQEFPNYLAQLSLFKVNTGLREQEVCGLKCGDEIEVSELNTSVFLIEGRGVGSSRRDRRRLSARLARVVELTDHDLVLARSTSELARGAAELK